jgi:hypothetical protein
MLLFVPPVALAVWVVWKEFRRWLAADRVVVRRYQIGFGLFIAAVVGFEFVTNLVPKGSALAMTQVLFEELCEMAGVTFLVWATWDLLASRGVRLVVTVAAPTRPPRALKAVS